MEWYLSHFQLGCYCLFVGNKITLYLFYYLFQNKFFYVEDDAGKEMLEEASLAGNREATFVLGMLMLADGGGRQNHALQLLTDAYPISSAGSRIIPALLKKVGDVLSWEGRREI